MTLARRAGAVLALSAVSLYLTAGRGVSPGDESWFLLVAKRVADGDDLYRDVFYSPLPLAVYVTAAPVALFGAHIAIVEVLIALTWACTALVVVAHACRVTGSRAVAALALMALVVVAPPQRNSLYTPLAMLLLLVCMLLATRLVEAGGTRRAFLAGAVAGLSFASKQTVGAGALAALLLCLAFAPSAWRRRGILAAVGGFAAVSAAFALVLALSGVLDDAVQRASPARVSTWLTGRCRIPARCWTRSGCFRRSPRARSTRCRSCSPPRLQWCSSSRRVAGRSRPRFSCRQPSRSPPSRPRIRG